MTFSQRFVLSRREKRCFRPSSADPSFQIIEHAVHGGRKNLNKAIQMPKREREVISLIADGLSNREIGQRLHIATYTIKSHIHNIMEKLALHTRLEVANYSYTDGTLTREVNKSISMMKN